jgi:uncharacterized protein (TIGR03086 family)
MKPSEQFQFQADSVRTLIAGMTPDQLDDATPCARWTTRDLLNHLVGGGLMFGAAFRGDDADGDHDTPVDLIGDDPGAAWERAVQSFNVGVDSDDALEREIPMPWGPTPGAVMLEILKFDVLVHAWDLARATGQSFDPPASIVDPLAETAAQILNDDMRDGDTFADATSPSRAATPMERLAAFTGRSIA